VDTRFQVLFHSPPGVLFTIPSRYYPLSVTKKYSGLPGGPGRFTADSTGPLLLGHRTTADTHVFAYGTLTLSGRPSQTTSANDAFSPTAGRPDRTGTIRPHNPTRTTPAGYTMRMV